MTFIINIEIETVSNFRYSLTLIIMLFYLILILLIISAWVLLDSYKDWL